MTRVVIVDDEAPAIERLKRLLRPFSDIDIVGEASDGLAALALIEQKKPDVVFLDIDLPELGGLDVARTLGPDGPLIIFATAYDEHALEAFEAHTIDYLVKPINASRLDRSIEKIRKSPLAARGGSLTDLKIKNGPARLAVRIGTKYEVFDSAAISAAIASDHYTALVVNGRELLTDDSLEALSSRFDPDIFIRVHRGAIINIKFLKELKREGDRKYRAVLSDPKQTEIAISRERLPVLKAILGLT